MGQKFRIDLREIEGAGEFACPTCREQISPDDESGMTYDVIEVKTSEDGAVREVIVQCKKCRSIIYLTGFEALEGKEDLSCLDDYLNFRVNLEDVK